MAENPWSWLRCERTHWRDREDDSLKFYIGHFRFDITENSWLEVQIPFWARQPYKAMRAVLQELGDNIPEEALKGTVIN
jgi:hypothetical protein